MFRDPSLRRLCYYFRPNSGCSHDPNHEGCPALANTWHWFYGCGPGKYCPGTGTLTQLSLENLNGGAYILRSQFYPNLNGETINVTVARTVQGNATRLEVCHDVSSLPRTPAWQNLDATVVCMSQFRCEAACALHFKQVITRGRTSRRHETISFCWRISLTQAEFST
jgi:hypothetical protein